MMTKGCMMKHDTEDVFANPEIMFEFDIVYSAKQFC